MTHAALTATCDSVKATRYGTLVTESRCLAESRNQGVVRHGVWKVCVHHTPINIVSLWGLLVPQRHTTVTRFSSARVGSAVAWLTVMAQPLLALTSIKTKDSNEDICLERKKVKQRPPTRASKAKGVLDKGPP